MVVDSLVVDSSVEEDFAAPTAPLVGVGTAEELAGTWDGGTVGTLGLIIVRVLDPDTVVDWEGPNGTVAPEVGTIPPRKFELEVVEAVASDCPLPVGLAVAELSDGELAPGRIPDRKPAKGSIELGTGCDDEAASEESLEDAVTVAGGEGEAGRLSEAVFSAAAGELRPSPVDVGIGEEPAGEPVPEEDPVADADPPSKIPSSRPGSEDVALGEEGLSPVADGDLEPPPKIPSSRPGSEDVALGEEGLPPVVDGDLDPPPKIPSSRPGSEDVALGEEGLSPVADGDLEPPPKIPSSRPGSEDVALGEEGLPPVVDGDLDPPPKIPSSRPGSEDIVLDADLPLVADGALGPSPDTPLTVSASQEVVLDAGLLSVAD